MSTTYLSKFMSSDLYKIGLVISYIKEFKTVLVVANSIVVPAILVVDPLEGTTYDFLEICKLFQSCLFPTGEAAGGICFFIVFY